MKLAATLTAFGLLYLICLNQPGLVDYDEACYAEVARSMMVSGDGLRPTLNGEPFYEKPPLLYWGEVAGFLLLGPGPAGARVLNAGAALALLLAVGLISRRALGEDAGWIAVLVLGTSFEFAVLARTALTDTWLTLFMMLSLFAFHRAFEKEVAGGNGARDFWMVCGVAGLAMLAKGVVGVLLPGAAILFALFRERRLRLLLKPSWAIPGGLLLVGVGFSWHLILGFTSKGGFSFLGEMLGRQHWERFSRPMEGHRGSIFYYIPVVLLGFMPWSPLVLPALLDPARREASGERRRLMRLMLAFAAVTFLLFTIAATKLPNYILPVLPPLALLIGDAWGRPGDRRLDGKRWTWALRASAVLLAVMGGALLALPLIWSRIGSLLSEKTLEKVARKSPGLLLPLHFGWGPYAGGIALIAGAIAVWVFRWRQEPRRQVMSLALASGAGFLVAVLGIVPVYDAHFLAPLRGLAREAASETRPDEALAILELSHLASVNFYSGRRTFTIPPGDTKKVDALFAGPRPVLGISVERTFDEILRGREAEVVSRDTGYVLFRCPPRPAGGIPREN